MADLRLHPEDAANLHSAVQAESRWSLVVNHGNRIFDLEPAPLSIRTSSPISTAPSTPAPA
jgi:hypothetical protein